MRIASIGERKTFDFTHTSFFFLLLKLQSVSNCSEENIHNESNNNMKSAHKNGRLYRPKHTFGRQGGKIRQRYENCTFYDFNAHLPHLEKKKKRHDNDKFPTIITAHICANEVRHKWNAMWMTTLKKFSFYMRQNNFEAFFAVLRADQWPIGIQSRFDVVESLNFTNSNFRNRWIFKEFSFFWLCLSLKNQFCWWSVKKILLYFFGSLINVLQKLFNLHKALRYSLWFHTLTPSILFALSCT